MPTEKSLPAFGKLSAEEIDQVLGQVKLSIDAGESRHKSDDPGEKAARQVAQDREQDHPQPPED